MGILDADHIVSIPRLHACISKYLAGQHQLICHHPVCLQAKAMADDAQRDLDEALPALEAATASLKNLSRNDVVEVKSLSNPPAGVKLVMEVRTLSLGPS